MEIRQLRHFIAAVEAGNLRKASEMVHISHPALSMSIKKLEEDLGVTLLFKNRRGVQPTYAGEHFLRSAHSLLRQIDDLRVSLQGTKESPTGNVRLGLTYGLNNALAALLYEYLHARLPGINLEVEEGNTASLNRLFESGVLDIMLGYDTIEKMDQKCEQLYTESLYFVSAYDSSISSGQEIELKDLNNLPIVCSPGTTSMRTTLEKYAFNNKIQFDLLSDFQSAHASVKIVEEGLANTISPWDEIYDAVAQKRVSACKIVNPSIERTVCLISSLSVSHSIATDAAITALKSVVNRAKSLDKVRGRPVIDSE